MSLIVLVNLICLFILASCAKDSSAKSLEYVNWRNEWYQVYSTEYAEGDIIIPSIYKGLPVLEINNYGFANRDKITSISIPDGVTKIKSGAFINCIALTSIYIPKSVVEIGEGVFSGCSSLMSIIVDNENQEFSGEGNCLVKKSNGVLLAGCQTSVIPSIAKIIGRGAFARVKIPADFIIPSNIIEIGPLAFYATAGVERLIISKNVQEIIQSTFEYCPDLKTVEFEADSIVHSLKSDAFSSCPSLEKITIPKSVKLIWYGTFRQNKNLKTVVFESGINLEDMNNNMFKGCESLTEITIPKSVKLLGSDIFADCTSLEKVTFEKGSMLGKIEQGAFLNCTSLREINLPDSLTTIEGIDASYKHGAFENCKNLEDLVIPWRVKTIEDYAFMGCDSLKTISVHESNITYKSDGNCLIRRADNTLILGSGESVIPEYITGIADFAFEGRIYLESITIPNGVKSVGIAAFRNCRNLSTVTLPNGLESIKSTAFAGCISINCLTIPKSAVCENVAFYNWGKNQTIIIEERTEVPDNWGDYWDYFCKASIILGGNE